MKMHNPPHPGDILKELYIVPLKLKQADVAKGLGVTTKALSQLINAHTGISISMSLKLAEAFNTTPEYWLNLQQQHDIFTQNQTFDAKLITHFYDKEQEQATLQHA